MESKVETTIDDTRASESATVTFQGRDYTAGGFQVDLVSGRMVAYVTRKGDQLILTTWAGQRIAGLYETGKTRGFYGAELVCYQTRHPVAGFYWHGRGLGEGMMLRLKKGRRA
ncbi:hypothetical protein LCGC14_1495940 [marine sediment metagenome]|uniref:Uncharacterized protein n=1 Tax=marine sediment metagenome TaxID=412755 RepID=A0A0F9J5G2_9ZZZZ